MFWQRLRDAAKEWAERRPILAVSTSILAVAVIAAFLWHISAGDDGMIIVSSPQVYTRERLVNDRYDQAHWLAKQMEMLDTAKNLVTGQKSNATDVQLGAKAGALTATKAADYNSQNAAAGTKGDTGGQNARVRDDDTGPLPFDLQFVIRASIRDSIRELALENSLDDRHDLRGNSLYGLKFDTTVIPRGRRDTAMVDVSVQLGDDNDLTDLTKSDPKIKLPNYVLAYYGLLPEQAAKQERRGPAGPHDGQLQNQNSKTDNARIERQLKDLGDVYGQWLDDVSQRLNQYADKLTEAKVRSGECSKPNGFNPNEVAQQTMAAVMGEKSPLSRGTQLSALPSQSEGGAKKPIAAGFTVSAGKKAQMPVGSSAVPEQSVGVPVLSDSLKRIMGLSLQYQAAVNGDPCGGKIIFQATRPAQIIYVLDSNEIRNRTSSSDEQLLNVGGPGIYIQTDYHQTEQQSSLFLVDGAMLSNVVEVLRKKQYKFQKLSFPGGADRNYFLYPIGLFNFIERAAQQDQFAYALLPRSEMAGFMVDNLTSLVVSAEGGAGNVQAGAATQFTNLLREAQAAPRTVAYSRETNSQIEFGWLVDANQPNTPTQKSHLALISVPAWVERIKLCVRTRWKSDGLGFLSKASPAADCHEMSVPVPRDMEALDSIIVSAEHRPGPRVFSQLMDDIHVTACRPAAILIPGEHLWRNTVVTLGGQRASRIIVLPDMKGIAAEFENIFPWTNPGDIVPGGGPASPPILPKNDMTRTLRVWTTEGSEVASVNVHVLPADDPAICQKIVLGDHEADGVEQ